MESIGNKLHRQLEDGFAGTPLEFEALVSALLYLDDSPGELARKYFDWHHHAILSAGAAAMVS